MTLLAIGAVAALGWLLTPPDTENTKRQMRADGEPIWL